MFKVLTEGCEPKRATKYSAAVDLFAAEDVVIKAGETVKVSLGIAIDIKSFWKKASFFTRLFNLFSLSFFMKRHKLEVLPRSSIGLKGLIIPNGEGVIDLDYKDEICLILHNPLIKINCDGYAYGVGKSGFGRYEISKGDKIAQIMLCEHKSYLMGYESEEERQGGFGSTGK